MFVFKDEFFFLRGIKNISPWNFTLISNYQNIYVKSMCGALSTVSHQQNSKEVGCLYIELVCLLLV